MHSNSNDSAFGSDAIELRLWEYIDGVSNEASEIEELIRTNEEWRARYAAVLNLHQLIGETELEQPSLRFTKNIMEQIARFQIAPATKKYIDTKIIWGLAAFFITIIAGFLIYGVSQIDWSAANSSKNVIGINLGVIDFSRMFGNSSVNGFMMLNILLGLLLLDRILNMKRNAYMEENL